MRPLLPLILLLLLLASPGGAVAGGVLQLPVEARSLALGEGHLEMLEDPSSTLDIAAVSKDGAARFRPLPGNLAAGYGSSAIWLRFTLERSAEARGDWLLEVLPPYLDDLRLFEPDGAGGFRQRQAGDRQPFAAREVAYRGFVFNLQVPPGRSTYYVRLSSTSTLAAILSLWPADGYTAEVQREYLLFGIGNGLILAAGIFSLCAWLYIREPLHLNFALLAFLQLTVIFTMQGFAAQYLMPRHPAWADSLIGILVGLGTAQTYRFFDLLLQLRRHFPRISAFFRMCIVIALLTALSVPLGWYPVMAPLLMLTGLISNALAYWPCRQRWRQGGLGNWIEVIALGLYIGVSSVHLVGILGLGPVSLALINGHSLVTLVYLLLLEFGVLLRISDANRRHLQAEAEAQRERLQREEQGRFLGMIAHELRTPISIVSASLQSLEMLDSHPEEPRQRRYNRIQRAVQRMDGLLQACLAEERMMSGRWLAQVERLDLLQLSRNVLDDFSEDVRERVTIQAPLAAPYIHGDKVMLRVVLRNLLENALKYGAGEQPVRIDITPAKEGEGDGWNWRISDGGPGVPPGLAEKIFEKYYRVGESSGTPGLGLGLYLSRRIVMQHGGRLYLDTARNPGASFVCWLPLTIPDHLESEDS